MNKSKPTLRLARLAVNVVATFIVWCGCGRAGKGGNKYLCLSVSDCRGRPGKQGERWAWRTFISQSSVRFWFTWGIWIISGTTIICKNVALSLGVLLMFTSLYWEVNVKRMQRSQYTWRSLCFVTKCLVSDLDQVNWKRTAPWLMNVLLAFLGFTEGGQTHYFLDNPQGTLSRLSHHNNFLPFTQTQ